MKNIDFWIGPAQGNQHGTTQHGVITKDGEHVAAYAVYEKGTMVSVTYEGRKKAMQISGSDWQVIAQMLLRELMGEVKAVA